MKKFCALALLVVLAFKAQATTNSVIENIVFDIDGVLLTTDKTAATREIGIEVIVQYLIENRHLPTQKELFDILDPLPAKSKASSWTGGLKLPQILVDWQTGEQTNEDLYNQILASLVVRQGLNNSKRVFIAKTVALMLKPALLAKTRMAIPDGLALLKTMQDRKFNTYLLSNWDKPSFPLIQAKFPPLVHGPNATMISAEEKMLKPNADFFQRFMTKFQIDPAKTIFIDDELKNVEGARAVGFHAIQCTGDYEDILRQINELIEGRKNAT